MNKELIKNILFGMLILLCVKLAMTDTSTPAFFYVLVVTLLCTVLYITKPIYLYFNKDASTSINNDNKVNHSSDTNSDNKSGPRIVFSLITKVVLWIGAVLFLVGIIGRISFAIACSGF